MLIEYRKWQEPRRPIILAKKEEKNDTPKILLKPKENEKEKKTASPQISIAARPSHSDANQNPINNVSIEHRNQPSKIASAFRDSKDSQQPSKEPQIQIAHIPQTILPQMNRPIPIISDHYQMPNLIQDYLIETNVDFFVVGCIGPLGSGKSSILNFLIDNNLEEYDGDIQTINDILKGKNGIFRTRSSGDAVFSNMPSTEGIQAYITKHRTIFLDCSPVLCNPYKKDGILNELDDLKMLIFLLSICNLLIVVDDSGFNMHLMRLIQMAENMKVDLFEKDLNDFRFSPNILICKNKCQNRDFLAESQQRSIQLYKGFFNGSNLKLTIPYANRKSDYSIVWNDDEPLNIFYFPMINDKSEFFFFFFLIC